MKQMLLFITMIMLVLVNMRSCALDEQRVDEQRLLLVSEIVASCKAHSLLVTEGVFSDFDDPVYYALCASVTAMLQSMLCNDLSSCGYVPSKFRVLQKIAAQKIAVLNIKRSRD